jgi:adenine-specific DNA-methyltransferase
MDGKSFNTTEDLINKLKEIAPHIFNEDKIDWEKMKSTFSDDINFSDERYVLNWARKSDAFRAIQSQTTATLIPDKEESVNFENTDNIFIEGENLEVLKVLQKAYYGKIKMIYIDPPYNTGNDFIYNDKFAEKKEEYLQRSGEKDNEGLLTGENLYRKNTKESGHYHSNWMTMMYPRLFLARNLLRDDGVIFVSIDDNEVHNLRMIMNEIFGEENFITSFIWNTEGHTDNQFQVKINHEYIIIYAKNNSFTNLGYVIDPNTRDESNLWKGFAENSITKNGKGNPPSEVNLPIGFPCKVEDLDLEISDVSKEFYKEVELIGYITRSITKKYLISYPIRNDKMICKAGKLIKNCRVFSGWANVNKLKQFINNKCNPIEDDDGNFIQFYLSENGVIYYRKDREKARNILSVLRNMGTTEQMRSELEEIGIYFDYPKPKKLLKYLIKIGLKKDELLLDFFAGSCTTAHAVLDLNKEDCGNRKFIMVQLPEKTDVKSEAYKAGYETIADIGKERIRRVIKKIEDEQKENLNFGENKQDLGFKVLKLQESNFKIWRGDKFETGEEFEEQLQVFVNPIKEGSTEENMLYELLLKSGIDLNCKIEKRDNYYLINENELIIALSEINKEIVKNIIDTKPLKVITLDKLFEGNDQLKTNTTLQMKDAGIEFKVV